MLGHPADRRVDVARLELEAVSDAPGSIRGDYSLSNRENAVHASDSLESAEREIAIFFPGLG